MSIILLGGCQMNNGDQDIKPSEMNPEDLPDVRAFEDEFTRCFLQSTEETRSGYYPFLSGTGKYEMDFPAGGVIGEKGYTKRNTGIENFIIGVESENGNMQINTSYNSIRDDDEKHLKSIEQNFSEELNFEMENIEDRTVYLTENPSESESYYVLIGYVQNQKESGGVEMRFIVEKNLNEEVSNIKKDVRDILKSIKFINNEESE